MKDFKTPCLVNSQVVEQAGGELMEFDDFMTLVGNGAINEFDGTGYFATNHLYDYGAPFNFMEAVTAIKPEWATHIMWFSK